ncbi:MAG: hypothetical protein M3033_11125 [Acidobacteriota bacterium]|nr:hypothetical protein [Acidobacteriota bacterium]
MKKRIHKIISAVLFTAILITSPKFLSAQNGRLVGELTVIKDASSAAANEEFVTIDGARATSGRSVMSPADIVTPAGASAKISIPQTGIVTISPGSKMNLSFVNSSIAGELAVGEITIETIPNTTINIFTRDGAITTPNRNEKTIVKISIENGAARVTTLNGQVMFNNVLVPAGEYFPQSKSNAADTSKSSDSSGGINPLLIVGILGAVGAAALIALSVSSNNSNSPTVSPTR